MISILVKYWPKELETAFCAKKMLFLLIKQCFSDYYFFLQNCKVLVKIEILMYFRNILICLRGLGLFCKKTEL